MNRTKSRKQGLTRLAVTLALVPVMALSSLASACPAIPGKLSKGKLGPIPTFLVPQCGEFYKKFINGVQTKPNPTEMYKFKPVSVSNPEDAGPAYMMEIQTVLSKYGYFNTGKAVRLQDNMIAVQYANKNPNKENLVLTFIFNQADRTMYSTFYMP